MISPVFQIWRYEDGFLAYRAGSDRLFRLNATAAERLPTDPTKADLAALLADPSDEASIEAIQLDAFASFLPLWIFQDAPPPRAASQ